MAGMMKTPPDGTGEPTPQIILRPPPTAAPTVQEKMTRNGSTAAIGITPSVIIQRPIGKAILMLSSSSVEYLGRRKRRERTQEIVTPNGGTIEAKIFTASGS